LKELIEAYPRKQLPVTCHEDIVYTQQAYMNNPLLAAQTAIEYFQPNPWPQCASLPFFLRAQL
jgi:hypothetical protein